MRQDQYERLQALEEELMDVFIAEANPTTWPGHGMLSRDMDRDTRGDRFWSKRNPAATLAIVTRVQALIHQTQQLGDTPPPLAEAGSPAQDGDRQLDDEILKAEREAANLMKKLQAGPEKVSRKAHGKA